MRLSLSSKLVLATTLGITLVLGPFTYLRFEREVALFNDDMRRDHRVLAETLATSVESVASRAGVPDALALIEEANEKRTRIAIAFVPDEAGAAPTDAASASVEVDGHLVTRLGVQLTPELAGWIEVRETLASQRAYLTESVARAGGALLLLIGLCAVILRLTFRAFVERPLARIVDKLHRMGGGDLAGPLAPTGHDELATVARELDATCDRLVELRRAAESQAAARLQAVEELRHAERLGTVGKMASGIAHELGTPLNVVSARAKMIVRGYSKGATAVDDARIIVEQVDRMAGIIRQLLDFARRRPPLREAQDLEPLLSKIVTLLQPLADRSGVRLVHATRGVPVLAEVDEGQLQQVLTNLVMNAIQAQPHGGEVRLRVGCSDRRDDEVVIDVEDDGPGIEAQVLGRIFEPFFTTKETGRGTGLGLSVAHGIVEEHGGRIEVAPSEARGSRFSVHLRRRAA